MRVHTNGSHGIIPRLISQEWRKSLCSAAELGESCFLPLNSTGSKLSLEINTQKLTCSFSLDLSMYSHKYGRDHINQELCPESAYVPVLLPSLRCSSSTRETKPTQKTKDNTLNTTQWLPCAPVSHFTFTQSVSTVFPYSQHYYPESCRINRAAPRAQQHWLPLV